MRVSFNEDIAGTKVMFYSFDVGAGWNQYVIFMFGKINRVCKDFTEKVFFDISRDGCFLNVNLSPILDEKLNYIIKGIISDTRDELIKICAKCGKNKGENPSKTVYPGLCEKCRSEIKPEDYKDDRIVCLSGNAGSGKDTVADYLVNHYGYKRMAFADPLRDIVQLVFAMDEENVWDRKLRELPLKYLPNLTDEKVAHLLSESSSQEEFFSKLNDEQFWSVRKLLQYIGTEMFRNEIWADTWINNFNQRIEPGFNYVLTDVRFPNELSVVKEKFGGKILFAEVVRDGCDGKNVGLANHESEKHKFSMDIKIVNNGTLEDLYHKVKELIVDAI